MIGCAVVDSNYFICWWRFYIVMSVWDAVGPVLCDLISYCLLLYHVSRTSVFFGLRLYPTMVALRSMVYHDAFVTIVMIMCCVYWN